jgi:DNA-binding NarL/FixJ family response regulator
MIVLNVRRITSQGPFGSSEKRFANWLYPLFEAAALRSFHLDSAPALDSPIAAALDGFSVGCILWDHKGQITFANRAAEAIALVGDGVYIREGALHFSDSAAEAALADAIAHVVAGEETGNKEIVIPRRAGPPLLGLVSLLPNKAEQDGAQKILYLVDILRESTTEKLERRARLLFGLTAAEANVLSLLLDGHDVDAIAERRRSSALTVRTQLKVLMQKTGVHRQRDLVRVNRLTDFVS